MRCFVHALRGAYVLERPQPRSMLRHQADPIHVHPCRFLQQPLDRACPCQAVLAMKLDDGESLALKVGHFLDGHHEEAKSPPGLPAL